MVNETPRGSIATSQQARADGLESRMNSRLDQPAIQVGPNRDDRGYANFPAKLIPKDPYDNTYATKYEQLNDPMYQGAGHDGKPQLVMPITQEDIAFSERKRKIQEKLKFDNWMATVIDLSNPTEGTSSSSRRNTTKRKDHLEKAYAAKRKAKTAAKAKGALRKPAKSIGKHSRSSSAASAHRKGKGAAR
jgi:hypothetical protein